MGEYVANGAWQTLTESWDGSAWSIVPSANSSSAQDNYLDGVTCLSARSCTAVGSFNTGQADQTLVETWDGASWSIVPSPNVGYIATLLRVSCPAPSDCTAVGEYRPHLGFNRTLIEAWDGTKWSVVPSPDASTSNNVLEGISCPSAGRCVAVGTFFNGTQYQLLSMSGDGRAWTLLPSPDLHEDGTGVTCVSVSNCTEVGASGLINTWDGKAWTPVPTPPGPGASRRLNSIDCVPSLCMAVGDYTEGNVAQTFVEEGCGPGGGASAGAGAGGGGAGTSRLSPDVTATGPVCPLDVSVKVLEPLRSGLAVHSHPYSVYPVDFAASQPGTATDRCQSGCVDIVVTVTNKRTGRSVKGALVNASVGKLTSVPKGVPPIAAGDQYLCATNEAGTVDYGCGAYLFDKNSDALHTDSRGRVWLRYWAPGTYAESSTDLNVTARVECSATACPFREMTGSDKVGLTVSPDLVYAHFSPLDADQVATLVEWAQGGGAFSKLLSLGGRAVKVLKYGVKWLELQELASKKLVHGLETVEKAEPVLNVIEVANILSDVVEQQTMIAEFLYVTDLDAVGLGRYPFEPSVSAIPDVTFSNKVANFGVPAPANAFAAGAWWEVAKELAEMDHRAGPIHWGNHYSLVNMADWGIKLAVYEVSNCDPGGGQCLPGYEQNGVRPELYFKVTLTYNGYPYVDWDFTVGYDAIAWTETQWDLRNVFHDAK